jgi:hypothetical protein
MTLEEVECRAERREAGMQVPIDLHTTMLRAARRRDGEVVVEAGFAEVVWC